MELLLFLSFCFLTLSGLTFAAESGTPVTRVTVREDDDVILPCSLDTNENIESMLFDWVKEVPRKEVFMYRNRNHYNNGLPGQDVEFKGRVSHFPEELKYGNASIRIKQTRLEDNGTYTCIFPDIKPSEKIFRIELVVEPVLKIRNFPGAAPKPYVTILKEKGLLECEVPGASPKPTVEWWDSDNKTLPTKTVQDEEEQGRFHVTVQTTVTEPGCYRCVATQMEKWHRISSEICVHHEQTVIVKEGDDAILSCSPKTKENIESKPFSWTKEGPAGQKKVFLYDTSNNDLTGQDKQFKGRVSNFPEGLKHGDASITIKNTKVTDTGKYICSFSHLQPKRNAEILLLVDALSGTGMIKAAVFSVICGVIGFFVAV